MRKDKHKMKIIDVKYPNLNAKLKGMYAKRITKTDLEDVIKQNNFKNAVLLLKNKSEVFKNTDENIDRLEVESLLEEDEIQDIKKILYFLNNKDREKFELFLQKYKIKGAKNIDKVYFENLYDEVKNINNLQKIVGAEIDLLNVLWIYRIKKYYNFKEKDLKQILIDRNYKLNSKKIDQLIKANSFNDIKEILQNTVYKNIFVNELDIENNIDKYLYSINKKIFKQDIMSIAYVYAYVNLINYENNDIVNTIEGIRYNMSRQEIQKRLVR